MLTFDPPSRDSVPAPVGGRTSTRDEQLEWSIHGFADRFPEYSARRTFLWRQRIGVALTLVLLAVCFVIYPVPTGTVLMAVAITLYAGMLWFRSRLMWARRGDDDPTIFVDAEMACATPDDELPVFSILVPAYREATVIPRIVEHLSALEYPADRVDVHLVLEEDDDVTLDAVDRLDLPPNFSIVKVPAAEPRTKPKACNYALASCRGTYVTIYDAEDRPEPLQLRRVAAAFAQVGPNVACLQAELSFFNADENLITRWFAVDYAVWFTQFLPGLAATDTPIPLGGTSNHIRRDVLVEIGAWDPFNVTEDADLGIRLHRQGFRVGIIDSITHEEANTDFVNWIKQRSRWYKGYLQTWLVHMRHPLRLLRDLGPGAFARFNLFVGGTPLLAALNPISWLLVVIWFVLKPQYMLEIISGPVYYAGMLSWIVGNFAIYYLNLAAAYTIGGRRLFKAALLLPLYWVMMSIAAVKALLQLVFNPNYWEKTAHGLSSMPLTAPDPAIAPDGSE
jgi:cellulose synthase/poly-beta-1,6-N-acetylglucosamine synthase-like glycosyltransferase